MYHGMLLFLQIFEYETTIKDVVDIHYPIRYPEESGNKGEMVCSNKIRWVQMALFLH